MLFKFCHIFYLIHTPHSCERMCCVHTCVHVCVDACPKAIHSATAVNQSIHMIILCGMYTRVCALACVCMSRTQLASAVTSCGHHSNRIYISSPSSFSASLHFLHADMVLLCGSGGQSVFIHSIANISCFQNVKKKSI